MRVKFYSPKRQYDIIKGKLEAEIAHLLSIDEYEPELQGYLESLEKAFASYCSAKYAVATDSGTGALQLSLLAAGIRPGDEVITTANTYIATALAISNISAKPVFADIQPDTFNIDPKLIEEKITPKTKAIIPVHLYGQTADMNPIMEIAKKHGLVVIEDACQAHGALYDGRKAGSIGNIGCFSFYSSKNLSGFGNSGIVVSNEDRICQEIRGLRDPEADFPKLLFARRTPAYMDSIQAAIIKTKLPFLESWNSMRRKIAASYNEQLKDTADLLLPKEAKNCSHTFHSYVIRTEKRDELRSFLGDRGVEAHIEYKPSIHLTKTFSSLGYKKGDLPKTEKAESEILSLPIYPYMKEEEIEHVIKSVKGFFR